MLEEDMQLIRLSKQEFEAACKKHPQYNFMQSIYNADRREKKGVIPHFVGLVNQDEILACAYLSQTKTLRFFSYFECMLGPMLDYHNKEVMDVFFHELTMYIKKHKGIYFLFNPNIIAIERDENAEIVKGGIDHRHIRQRLISLGFRWLENINENPLYTTWYFIKDLSSIQNQEQLMDSFSAKTRYNIRKAMESNIQVVEMTYDELHEFEKILEITANKRNIEVQNLQYLQQFYNSSVTSKHAFFLKAQLDVVDTINKLQEKLDENIDELETVIAESNNLLSKKKKSKINAYKEVIDAYHTRIEQLKQEEQKVIVTSAALFLMTENEMNYFVSGSNEKYNKFFSPYLIQYEAMKRAIELNIPTYNFYSTNGNFNNKPEQEGVYRFKKGFTGVIQEKIGFFDLVINKPIYNIIQQLKKLKP